MHYKQENVVWDLFILPSSKLQLQNLNFHFCVFCPWLTNEIKLPRQSTGAYTVFVSGLSELRLKFPLSLHQDVLWAYCAMECVTYWHSNKEVCDVAKPNQIHFFSRQLGVARGSLTVNALDCGWISLGSSPCLGRCVARVVEQDSLLSQWRKILISLLTGFRASTLFRRSL